MALSPTAPVYGLGESGRRAPDWIRVVDAPDTYRGRHRGHDAGEEYAQHVARAVSGGDVAAFFMESAMSVGGVVLPPPKYLETCYAVVRAAGGVTVADEVQVGFGRVGDSFWAFTDHEVVPDILTIGKPIGNVGGWCGLSPNQVILGPLAS